jgi:hypothetical protein
MAAMTLIEAAKLMQNNGDTLSAAVATKFAESSMLFEVLPFQTIAGNALSFNREDTLPGVGFRGVNESYSDSNGVLLPLVEPLRIAGGDADVDNFIISTGGAGARTTHTALKIRAMSLLWASKFIKGDNSTDVREFDGLQNRLINDQLILNHATGAGLSLDKLRQAIDQTDNPTALIMSKAMRRRLSNASMTTTVGGFVSYTTDSFARRVTNFDDLPIIEMDRDNLNADILGFTETNSTTSIYVVSFADGGVTGLQNNTLTAQDIGQLETKPAVRTRVDWYNAFTVFNGRAATRLSKITDVAVTA